MLELKTISKDYGNGCGIHDVSLQIPQGSIMGILGINGSGKTTTFRILLGLLEADAGEVYWNSSPLPIQNFGLFGYLPEERSLLKDLSVTKHVWYLASLKGMSKKAFGNALDEWLSFFQMERYAHTRIGVLSKGNQQKVQLLCALIHDPDIYIFDEPLSGLDLDNQALFVALLALLKKRNKTVLLSTHTLHQLEAFCDGIAVLQEGKVILSGDLKQLKARHGPCLVLPEEQFHEKLVEGIAHQRWHEEGQVWLQMPQKQREQIIRRLLRFEFEHFELREVSLRKLLQEVNHAAPH